MHPIDPGTQRAFMLCEDEKALELAGLPSYASSLHRYLWNGPGVEEPIFLAVTSGAPLPPGVRSATDVFKGLYPFNPGGGLLLVRPLAPLALTEFADVLSGKTWPGFQCGKEVDSSRCGLCQDLRTLRKYFIEEVICSAGGLAKPGDCLKFST